MNRFFIWFGVVYLCFYAIAFAEIHPHHLYEKNIRPAIGQALFKPIPLSYSIKSFLKITEIDIFCKMPPEKQRDFLKNILIQAKNGDTESIMQYGIYGTSFCQKAKNNKLAKNYFRHALAKHHPKAQLAKIIEIAYGVDTDKRQKIYKILRKMVAQNYAPAFYAYSQITPFAREKTYYQKKAIEHDDIIALHNLLLRHSTHIMHQPQAKTYDDDIRKIEISLKNLYHQTDDLQIKKYVAYNLGTLWKNNPTLETPRQDIQTIHEYADLDTPTNTKIIPVLQQNISVMKHYHDGAISMNNNEWDDILHNVNPIHRPL